MYNLFLVKIIIIIFLKIKTFKATDLLKIFLNKKFNKFDILKLAI